MKKLEVSICMESEAPSKSSLISEIVTQYYSLAIRLKSVGCSFSAVRNRMHLHNKSVGRFQRLVSSPLNVPCSGCRPRRVVKAKALGISSNASFTLRAENLPSFGGGPSFEGVFSKQIEPLQGIVENMKGLDDIVSQVRNPICSLNVFGFYLMPCYWSNSGWEWKFRSDIQVFRNLRRIPWTLCTQCSCHVVFFLMPLHICHSSPKTVIKTLT